MGDFKKNQKDGMGAMTAPSGEEHIGEFQDDQFHGEGVHTWPNGVQGMRVNTETVQDMASVN